jgi:hypothetical protein
MQRVQQPGAGDERGVRFDPIEAARSGIRLRPPIPAATGGLARQRSNGSRAGEAQPQEWPVAEAARRAPNGPTVARSDRGRVIQVRPS